MSEETPSAPVPGGDAITLSATPKASPTEPPAVAPRPRPISDPALNAVRLRAAYLTSLRNVVNAGTDSRRAWVRQVGIFMQDALNRPMGMVTPQAAKIGQD
ncbi:MAG: hypothetical protein FJ033_12760 [Chloroflexi bacterium]|nr:hypothetical protein [Chloroflexota bacterium]